MKNHGILIVMLLLFFVANPAPFYARRPVSVKGDKALFELRLRLLKMKRDQIQGLYEHMRKSSEENNPGAWPVANSLYKLPTSGMQ